MVQFENCQFVQKNGHRVTALPVFSSAYRLLVARPLGCET